MPIKTFRGSIEDGGQDTVVLHTNDGSTGYQIKKFMIMPLNSGTTEYEHTIKIYKIPQTTVDQEVNFNDNTLLAAAYTEGRASSDYIGQPLVIFFDKEIVNQDIYLTQFDSLGALACNYYIELEQIKLDLNENTVATLKDIRNLA